VVDPPLAKEMIVTDQEIVELRGQILEMQQRLLELQGTISREPTRLEKLWQHVQCQQCLHHSIAESRGEGCCYYPHAPMDFGRCLNWEAPIDD
jgi:hypothetical protein